jgi:hypothetical protein
MLVEPGVGAPVGMFHCHDRQLDDMDDLNRRKTAQMPVKTLVEQFLPQCRGKPIHPYLAWVGKMECLYKLISSPPNSRVETYYATTSNQCREGDRIHGIRLTAEPAFVFEDLFYYAKAARDNEAAVRAVFKETENTDFEPVKAALRGDSGCSEGALQDEMGGAGILPREPAASSKVRLVPTKAELVLRQKEIASPGTSVCFR